ncbi:MULTISPECIES: NAD-dependent succinate-semialdehyde dehydrogenase [Comamonadaceae]|jgi:succinate-semialdehyde dehydrogenase/glutarate-semialdehyde dehydrogenase|uniref:NAD-dependent succinate-semialdehyde dehydrogenase n=1 Tax=Comamonadaceae TaxID=80864 RepID=UPI000F7ED3A6|nr:MULTISPECIES: NAD-dependent succinate-semialdehyde dehydrogenase [Comamonadaceae]MBT9571625.1 NAD-dependent succinate-semialdehyde dehydrogenase [Pseudomonas umsongensis]RUP25422.1 MAG: NAD-dependent succinate-semialdehyde dehydrogenase [Curvibacter sp.]MDC2862906.1 NAD-dependent succinate-semialdehyde dehydrogenase [Delftia sp. DT-2]MDH0852273.1 NAD-dependent succinate-semialdehyde dehydrogenase [Delftia tsuruhatensis]QRI91556.1 NAD-dependent succinate-semialdehyde dehydrogenase [Delftia l
MYPQLSLYIDGQMLRGEGRREQDVLNPANNQVIGQLPHATQADLDMALAAAQRAFASWRNSTAMQRAQVLKAVAALIRERAPQIGRNLTLEQGKPLAEGVGEVAVCAEHAEWHAEECRRIYGRLIPPRDASVQQTVLREPIGVCVAFSPWNFPFSQAFRKVVAAIGAGCTVILKGSSDTPASVQAIAQLFHDAGLPPGVLNVVSGDSGMISDYLIRSPIVRKISFTGSTPVGQQLAALAGQMMKRTTMELGGHAPVIVCDDADIDRAADVLSGFKFRNAGQVCISPTRFYVQDGVYDRFVERFAQRAQALAVGDGLVETNRMGPLAQPRRVAAMEDFVEDARQRGAKIVAGGHRLQGDGNFFAPTVLADLPDDSRFMTEEPFGPMAGMVRFKTVEEVLARANSLPFGLASYAFTTSLKNAHQISRGLEAGMVSINHIGLALAETPFGGIKESGYGSEGGSETFDGYLTTKFVSQLN